MNARLQRLLAYAPSGAGERNMSYRSACEGTRTRRGATCLARLHIMWVPFWLLLLGNVALGDTFLVKSEDRGRSWMDADLGPPHHLLISFKAVPGTSTIYALTQTLDDGYRIVVSKDSGTTWHVLERLSVRGAEVLGFTVQAGNPDVVYVAKTASSPHDGPHSSMILIKTTDAGNTVTEFPASGFELPGGVVEGRYFRPVLLAFVASPSGILYANAYCGGDDDGNFCPEAWSGNSIVRSVDGGYNWTSFSEYGSVFDVLFDHSAASTVYLVTNRELLRSSDGGETWASIKPAGCRQAPVLAVHTRNPAVLMNVCLYHEAVLPGMTRNSPCLYRSIDYGETWERVHVFESGPLQNLTFDAEDDSLIYGLTTSNEPMRSEDGGRTFTRMFANLPRLAFILAGPSSQNTIWAGTVMRFPVAFGQRHTFVRDVLGRSEIAPGKIMSIYGEELASDTRDAEVLPWPDSLLGAAVRFSGRPASVSSVSPNQINVQVPFGIDEGPVMMEVTRSDGSSHRQTVFALSQAPVILTSGPRGTGAPLIFHGADFRPVTADNPARAGELLSLYCYGLGELNPVIGTGILPPLPPPRVVGRLKVTFRPFNSNSVFEGELLWAGAAPGIIGVYQVNIRVPDTLVTDRYSISIVGAAVAATVALDVLR